MIIGNRHQEIHRLARMRPNYLLASRAPWMTDEQWRQLDAYRQGREIPTDSEIVDGLQHCSAWRNSHRAAEWVYRHVSDCIVNENFEPWCQEIRKCYDPDLQVDIGL